MIKRVLRYIAVVAVAFVVGYFTQQYVLKSSQVVLSYSLLNMFLFHAIASVIVYGTIEITAEKLPSQAGYAYLAAVFLKIGFFILIFNAVLFPEIELPKVQRLSLIIPLFLFLIIEAVAISKLLSAKQY